MWAIDAVKAFFTGKETLPMHEGSRSNNGVQGVPVVNRAVALSVVWALFSFLIIFYGYSHCRKHAYNYSITCQNEQCTWQSTNTSLPIYTFPKKDFIGVETVRITKNGEYADNQRMKENKKDRYGYSIKLRFKYPIEEGSSMKTDKDLIFAPYDMGRRYARSGVNQIRRYFEMENEEDEASSDNEKKKSAKSSKKSAKSDYLYYNKSRPLTAFGVIMMFIGAISLITSCLFGQWAEASPRRLKKAS